jgi:hypothetical protein
MRRTLAPSLILWLAAATGAAQTPRNYVAPDEPGFREVARGTYCRIITRQAPLTPQQGAALARRVDAAYYFDLTVLGWHDLSKVTQPPVTVKVLTDEAMKQKHPGTFGVTTGENLFEMGRTYVDDPNADLTLAHELTHVQDERQMNNRALPMYMMEARATYLAYLYTIRIGSHFQGTARAYANAIMQCNRNSAMTALKVPQDNVTRESHSGGAPEASNFANGGNPDLFAISAIGRFYMEWLRVKFRGRGYPDTLQRASTMMEWVGRGKTFPQAFQIAFGVAMEQAQAEFFAYLDQTQAAPQERIKGTIWQEDLAPPTR